MIQNVQFSPCCQQFLHRIEILRGSKAKNWKNSRKEIGVTNKKRKNNNNRDTYLLFFFSLRGQDVLLSLDIKVSSQLCKIPSAKLRAEISPNLPLCHFCWITLSQDTVKGSLPTPVNFYEVLISWKRPNVSQTRLCREATYSNLPFFGLFFLFASVFKQEQFES